MVSQPYEEERIREPAYTGLPVPYDSTMPDKGRRNQGIALIVVGLVLLVIGLIFATEPLRWKSARDIANSWEGTDVSGYYRYHDEGDKAIIIGEITDEIPVELIVQDTINYTEFEREYYDDLGSGGYHYAYYLDHVYDLEMYSINDIGNIGDEVALESTLKIMTLGGTEYWVWTAVETDKPSTFSSLIIGIPLLILGLVLAVMGASRYLAYKRELKKD